MSEVRFAIVGCGAAGSDFCRAIGTISDARVVAVFDTDITSAQRLATACGARAHATFDDLLADDRVDAVYIGVPHDQLARLTESAIRSRRHTLAEKPLALDARTAERLGTLAADVDIRLGVFFVLRHSAIVRWARAALRDGAIGEVRAVRIRTVIDKPAAYWSAGATAPGEPGWRAGREQSGGGVVLMNSIHLLDAVRFVTGGEYVRAIAEAATFTPGVDVEDTAAAVLRLSNGAVVSLTATANSAGARHEELISIDGTAGRIDLPYLLGSRRAKMYLRLPWESHPVQRWFPVDARANDCAIDSIRSFLGAIRDGSAPSPGAQDAMTALDVVDAIYRSASEHRAIEIVASSASARHRSDAV